MHKWLDDTQWRRGLLLIHGRDLWMNFIFDIGNVLIDFKPELFLHRLFDNPLAEDKINQVIFKSNEWVKLDQGIITPEEACRKFCSREPQYQDLIKKTMERLPEMLTPMHETIALLPKIKEAGHQLYYLSNFHKKLRGYVQDKYSFFSLFDGGVFSCDVHQLKPAFEIYRCLLDKYSLTPQDCLFIDDIVENVKSAEMLGIQGELFTDVQKIEQFIQ